MWIKGRNYLSKFIINSKGGHENEVASRKSPFTKTFLE